MADYNPDPTGLFQFSPRPTQSQIMSALLRGEPMPQPPGFNVPPLQDSQPTPLASLPSAAPGRPVSRAAPQPMPQAMPRPVQQPQGGQYAPRPDPMATDDLEARNAVLMKQQQAAEQQLAEASKAPDASAMQALGEKRNAAGAKYLMLALAAQRAGPGFEPISQDFMKRSAAEAEPIRSAAGQLTDQGWVADPAYLQAQIVKGHEAKIAAIDRALQANLQIGERRRLEAEKQQAAADLRNAMLGVQQSIAQQSSLDRRYAADLAHDDRQAALDAKANAAGKGNVDPQHLIDLVGEARKYLPKATASGAGALVDQGAHFFGKTTAGAQASARLNVIGGQLVMAQPRMEGPQSDRDVQLYREMAGSVNNPGLPIPERLAALDTIETLARKYQSGEYAPPGKTNTPVLPRARAAAAASAAGAAPGEVDFGSLPPGR